MEEKKPNNLKKRGFGSMSKEQVRKIASMGGKATSSNFKHDPERARRLGRKGGRAENVRNAGD